MLKIKYLLLFGALGHSLAAGAQEPAPPPGEYLDGVVAIVNEGIVVRSELERQIASIERRAVQGDIQLPPQNVLEEQVLERLIVEEVQMQRADRVGIQISDQMLNASIARIADEAGVSFEDMPALLAEDGVNYQDFRSELRRQLTMDQLRRIEVMGRIAVSQREIQQCLADIEDNVVVNSSYNLSHILISVPDSATNAQYAEAESEANEVYEQLNNGAEFSEMAIRYSDSQAALEGGLLGWRKGSELPTLFFDIVDTLDEGEVSAPVRNVSGFHLVKVNEIRSANQRSEIEQSNIRHILIIPNEIIDDATARQRLQEAREKVAAGEDFGELAKLLSDDPGSVNNGGELGWAGPGVYAPEFEAVARDSELNVISEPFRTQFGWHVLEVTGRRTYDNTEDLKQNSCANRIRNSKLASETEVWVRRLRDEAYVDKRI